jgi:hypothetical protein
MDQSYEQVDVVYRLLDEQLTDVDGRRCGRADDLEFSGGPGEDAWLVAILSGSGTWHRRLPRRLRGLTARAFGEGTLGKDVTRVPWENVDDVASDLKLRRKAEDLGLAEGDLRLSHAMSRLPRGS